MTRKQSLLIDGEWVFPHENGLSVTNPYSNDVLAEVPVCGPEDVEQAVTAAANALRAGWPQHERAATLDRAVRLAEENLESLAHTICVEAAKPIRTARIEAARCVETLRFSAAECRKLIGEMVPMEASAAGEGKLGFVLRLPIGVVAAITPFNFPLNLVAHKVAPAIAAGCPVVIKPATATPLSAIALAEILATAGTPKGYVNVVTGPGGAVGGALAQHPDVAYVSFTGSAAVGWDLRRTAFKKKVGLELGATSPLIVEADGDYERAAQKASLAAFSHAGQSCISTQRIYAHVDIFDAFCDRLTDHVDNLVIGDPADEETDVSQLITTDERDRVRSWIDESTEGGARVLTGGTVDEAGVLAPTVVTGVTTDMKLHRLEVFGPVVTVTPVDSFGMAIDLANDGEFGLQAGVFTADIAKALEAVRRLDFGGVIINDVPTFRADQQPYGGVRESGNTREGPAYAVREMTELRMVAIQP